MTEEEKLGLSDNSLGNPSKRVVSPCGGCGIALLLTPALSSSCHSFCEIIDVGYTDAKPWL